MRYILSYLDVKTTIYFSITNKLYKQKYYPTQYADLLKNKLIEIKEICEKNNKSLEQCIIKHNDYMDTLCCVMEYPSCSHCIGDTIEHYYYKSDNYCSHCLADCSVCGKNCIPKCGECDICRKLECRECSSNMKKFEYYCDDINYDDINYEDKYKCEYSMGIYICSSCCIINRYCKNCKKLKCPLCMPLNQISCHYCLKSSM